MRNSYEDIINLPNHRSKTHPPMSNHDRAAQFAPFAALTGHESAVIEAGRKTEARVELDEYIKEDLNKRLCFIQDRIGDKVEVSMIYFEEDRVKSGGSYLTATGHVKKINEDYGLITMDDNREILIKDIIEINSDLFLGPYFRPI